MLIRVDMLWRETKASLIRVVSPPGECGRTSFPRTCSIMTNEEHTTQAVRLSETSKSRNKTCRGRGK